MDQEPQTPSTPRPARTGRRRSAIGWFVHRYGWRAYAIPILLALTVVVILQAAKPPVSTAGVLSAATSAGTAVVSANTAVGTTTMTVTAAPTSTGSTTAAAIVGQGTAAVAPPTVVGSTGTTGTTAASAARKALGVVTGSTGPIPTGIFKNLSSAALPPGGAFAAKGRNAWHVVKGTSPPMGSGPARFTFTVEVEDGIRSAQSDQEFASLVDSALADPRSWVGSGKYTLQRVDTGNPSFRISLTSQLTVRNQTLCGWDIRYEASCYARGVHRVAVNDARWTRGAVSFNGDLGSYRVYAINHEVGHALGYLHQPCPVNGGLAPVMMQQSWSTANNDLAPLNPQLIPLDGKICHFNPYPYPLGSAAGTG